LLGKGEVFIKDEANVGSDINVNNEL